MVEDMGEAQPPARRRRWLGWPFVAVGTAIVLGAAALSVSLALGPASAASSGANCSGGGARLTVQGSGRAVGTPNSLDVSADVTVNGATAADALSADNATTAAVVAAIENDGVANRDISTTDLTVNPTYDWSNGHNVITGYQVSNSIAVTIRHLSTAGAVIDAAATAGGDSLNIDSITFARLDPRVLEDEARQNAVRQAVAHAGAMARAAGERLAGVCTITDQSAPMLVEPLPIASSTAMGAAASSVPLERGTQEADAQVTLVYALATLGS